MPTAPGDFQTASTGYDGFQMVSRRLPDSFQTAARRLPDGLQTGSKRAPDRSQTGSKQVPNRLKTVVPDGLRPTRLFQPMVPDAFRAYIAHVVARRVTRITGHRHDLAHSRVRPGRSGITTFSPDSPDSFVGSDGAANGPRSRACRMFSSSSEGEGGLGQAAASGENVVGGPMAQNVIMFSPDSDIDVAGGYRASPLAVAGPWQGLTLIEGKQARAAYARAARTARATAVIVDRDL